MVVDLHMSQYCRPVAPVKSQGRSVYHLRLADRKSYGEAECPHHKLGNSPTMLTMLPIGSQLVLREKYSSLLYSKVKVDHLMFTFRARISVAGLQNS